MNAILDGVALWLADFHLVATALLLGVLATLAVVKQPARRMAVVKATLVALAGLVLLCALPGWSAVHLLTDRPAPLNEAIGDRIEEVSAEQSVTQLTPHINVDLLPLPQGERPSLAQLEIAPASSQKTEETNWVRVGIFLHAAGSAMVVAWLLVGAVMARRIRRSTVAASAELHLALERIAGPSSAPHLLASDEVATPVAMGVFDPAIILPSAMVGASDPLAPILAHEFAHVRNGDLRSLALSRLLLVLLWPQPLYWWLRRSLRLDQEALADAAAAEAVGRLEYAERLVGWAKRVPGASGAGTPRLAGAVGLWEGPSQLKRRVALLLNEQFLVIRSCSRRWRGACFAAMALAAVGLSLVTLQPASDAASADEDAENESERASEASGSSEASSATAKTADERVLHLLRGLKSEPNAIVGCCLDDDGRPVGGVEVSLYRHDGDSDSLLQHEPRFIDKQVTAEDGKYRFNSVIDVAKEFPNGLPDERFPVRPRILLAVVGRAPGRAVGIGVDFAHRVASVGSLQAMRMSPPAEIRGRVTGPGGRPVVGAVVTVNKGRTRGLAFDPVRTDDDGRYVITDLAPSDARSRHVLMREKMPALADKDGRIDGINESLLHFLMGSIPHGVVVRHPDYAAHSAPLSRIPAELDISLIPGGAFEGRVMHADGETSRPAARVEVVAQMVSPQQQSQDPFAPGSAEVRTLTDADGKYRFDSLPVGTYRVGVEPIDTWVNDWVETAVVAPRRTSKAPEILLTHGGVVRVQLIDVETGKPPALPPGARGYIFTTAPVDNDPATADPETGGTGLELPFRTPVTAFTETGMAERHLPAGRYVVSAMIRGREHDWSWEGLGKSPIGNPVHKIVPGKTVEVAVRVRKQASERSRSGTWVRVPPRKESTGDSGGSKKKGEPKETKNEKPSSNSSGGLEVKDWGQRLRYASPKSSDGWWLVRSAAADADAGRATLGAEVADVGFAAPLDYGDNLKVTLHFAPEDDGPESKATPRSAPVRDAR